MTDVFDPANHTFCETRWFEDFKVGERFYIASRTMTDALFSAFQLASGDNHPIHYDRPYCKARGHKDMLAHGYQVLIQACAGAGVLPHHMGDAMIGFLDQASRFLAPVYVGDTLYPQLEIAELKPGRTTGTMRVNVTIHNQDGVLVCDGHQTYLLKKRTATS